MVDRPLDATRPLDRADVLDTSRSAQERRRPGRNDAVSPELVTILRGTGEVPDPIEVAQSLPDYPAFARGLAVGLLLSAVIWVAVGLLLWHQL
jgi:hypothetical protein